MLKLYLDCDGVILDTITMSYKLIHDMGLKDREDIDKFYRDVSWEELIIKAGEINDSISKIKKLMNNFEITILTHVSSDGEGKAKKEYFGNVLPEIPVLTVPKSIKKSDFVDPSNCILVDDFLPNLEYWEDNGGIGVKFSDSGKRSKFITITDLLDLLKIDFEEMIKVRE